MLKHSVHLTPACQRACRLTRSLRALASLIIIGAGIVILGPALARGQVRQCGNLRPKEFPSVVSAVAFSGDGKLLAAVHLGGAREQVKIWNVAGHREVATLLSQADPRKEPSRGPMCVAFAPDSKTLAVGGTRERARLYDTTSWKVREELFVPNRPDVYGNRALAFSPDGKTLATVSEAGGIRLWDPRRGRHLEPGGAFEVHFGAAIAFSPDGKILAGARAKGVVLWDLADGRIVDTLAGPNRRARSVAIAPGGRLLAAAWEGFQEKHVLVWDLPRGKVKARLNMGGKYSGEACALAFSPDGRIIALAGVAPGRKTSDKAGAPVTFQNGGRVRLWDANAGRELDNLSLPMPADSVAFSPAGPMLAVGCLDGAVYLYDVSKVGKKE